MVVVAGLFGSPTPPLFDGIGFPDEPYRYVQRPVGDSVRTVPPTAAAATTSVANGTNSDQLYTASLETGAQVTLFMPAGGLATPAGAHSCALRAVPAAPSHPPEGGRIDGNVYRVTADSDGGPVALTARAGNATVQLRATTARQPPPAIDYRSGSAWRALRTVRAGNDVYAANLVGFGDYAVVFASGPATGTHSGSPGRPVGLVIVVALLVAFLAGIILTLRLVRGRSR